jgi:hypothetical protein
MTAKAKTVNYTPEQVTILREGFAAGNTVENLAMLVGKSTRSVIAKLVKENVGYKAKTYVSKTGEKVVKKDETADAIGAVLKLTESETESLTKANKTALVKIFKALANSKPLADGEPRAGEVAPTVSE